MNTKIVVFKTNCFIICKNTNGINIIKNSSDIVFMEDRNPIEYTPVPPMVNIRPNNSGANTIAPARRNDGYSSTDILPNSVIHLLG